MANKPTSRQFQGQFNALRATKSHSLSQTIDIAAGNYGTGKYFSGAIGLSDPAWTGATGTFYVYLDQTDNLVLDDIGFPALCTRIARVVLSSGNIIDVIDERAEVNGLLDAYEISFDDSGLQVAAPADDVQTAIELLDGYLGELVADSVRYIDLDIGGGIRNALVRLGHLDDAPAVEFPKRPTGVGRIRYTVSVPKDWVKGTDIIVKIFWSPSDAGVGDINWRIRYKVITSNTEGVDLAMTTSSVTQSAPAVQNRLVNTGSSLFIPSNKISAGDILIINVEREYSINDTFNATARMHLVRLEYTGNISLE